MSPELQALRASRELVTAVLDRRRATSARVHGHSHASAAPTLLAEECFRAALQRECRRTERSKETFAVALLRLNGRALDESPLRQSAISAMAASKRGSDILGWFEQGAVLGVILTEAGGLEASTVEKIETRFRRELAARVGERVLERLSFAIHFHEATVPAAQPAWFNAVDVPAHPWRDGAKRALDIAGSLAALIVLSPVFLLTALAVKLTSNGPVFFRQVRVGQNMAPFTILKFRSMRTDCAHDVHLKYVTEFITAGDKAKEASDGQTFKMTNDARITPIGQFIRKTSIDELPQFWNVLMGEMSLVGPRPPLFYEVEQYQKWHCRRVFDAKPGITGLWQVSGRSRTTFDEMVRLDIRYARNRSLATDLRILFATPGAVIAGKGAC